MEGEEVKDLVQDRKKCVCAQGNGGGMTKKEETAVALNRKTRRYDSDQVKGSLTYKINNNGPGWLGSYHASKGCQFDF